MITITTRCRDWAADELAHSLLADKLTPGNYVELEVRDSGCGMDEAVQKRLFDPFFTTKFTGRGLGMSVVQGVVRGHKGAIFVSSKPNWGTTISVLFSATAVPSIAPASTPPAPAEEANHTPENATILVVEDEVMIRLLMERILKRMGFRVIAAENGHEAIALFQQHANEISFVILDFTMPKLDGLRTLAELRRIQPQVKAVLTSGYDVESISQNYAQEGFAAFIRKPLQVETLMKIARQLGGKTVGA